MDRTGLAMIRSGFQYFVLCIGFFGVRIVGAMDSTSPDFLQKKMGSVAIAIKPIAPKLAIAQGAKNSAEKAKKALVHVSPKPRIRYEDYLRYQKNASYDMGTKNSKKSNI